MNKHFENMINCIPFIISSLISFFLIKNGHPCMDGSPNWYAPFMVIIFLIFLLLAFCELFLFIISETIKPDIYRLFE